eukprot:1019904-Prymnesium_polylepis.1
MEIAENTRTSLSGHKRASSVRLGAPVRATRRCCHCKALQLTRREPKMSSVMPIRARLCPTRATTVSTVTSCSRATSDT